MPLIFYYMRYSSADFTRAILAELDHETGTNLAQVVDVNIKEGDTKTPQFLAINPNGRIPAIVHDGVSIWESAAITMYLAELFGEKNGLYPALGPHRGEAMKWIVWTNVSVAEAASRILYSAPSSAKDVTEAEKTKSADKETQARADIDKYLGILEGALDGREFLLKGGYCLADTHLWAMIRYVTMLRVSLDAYPRVKDWVSKIAARPALANVL